MTYHRSIRTIPAPKRDNGFPLAQHTLHTRFQPVDPLLAMLTCHILLVVFTFLVLVYFGRGYLAWVLPALGTLLWWHFKLGMEGTTFNVCVGVFAVLALVFGLPGLRRVILTGTMMKLLAPIFPKMSRTEREALEAGTVWWDAELFAGTPRWKKLLDFKPGGVSEKEQRFLDGPVEKLCTMVSDFEINQASDLPPEVWEHLKREKFLGLIIPESYGGLGFSAAANSAVVAKVASRSVAAAVSVMVPNSLGPAELLLHYGTEEQKSHYLPRLAVGEEIPCFTLTEPGAGSDAGAMRSSAVVCNGTYKGEATLGMLLNFEKRYITLNSNATLLGMAFKLRDPDGLLGDTVELGITCALIPAGTPGIDQSERHDPLGVPFINGPLRGQDVFVPLDAIIGGTEMAGQGWRMLMDCLAAGRGISLPAQATAGAQLAVRGVGAYATIREQFNMPIGRFEGIEEPLSRIGGLTYAMSAARRLTCGAIDAGEKPAVITAIMKAYTTDSGRQIVNDALDVVGGSGIVRGPRNIISGMYQAMPVGITVEGANILTRSMIIFGQGAIRCHPYAFDEIEGVRHKDVARFDRAIFKHIGLMAQVGIRSLWGGLTCGRLFSSPVSGPTAKYFRRFARMSSAYAFTAELAMLSLGGTLKRKEKITGRFADALAWMYLGTASLKQFEDDARPASQLPFVSWVSEHALYEIQQALGGIIDNLPNALVRLKLRFAVFPLGRCTRPPSDRISGQVARALLDDGEARLALSHLIYVPDENDPGLGRLERALKLVVAAAPARKKMKRAAREKKIPRGTESDMAEACVTAGILSEVEAQAVTAGAAARDDLIQVDSFGPEEYSALFPRG